MNGLRIAFVAPPFAGHLYPMLPLARAAREAGAEVEVLTGAAKLEVLRAAGFNANTLPSLGAQELEAIANPPHAVGINPRRLMRQMSAAFDATLRARLELHERWSAHPPDLVVADFMAIPAGVVASELALPWITLIRPAFALEGHDGPPSYLGGLRPWGGALGSLRDRLGWAAVRAGKDALAWVYRSRMHALGLRRRRADGSEAIYSPRAILALEMQELEFPRTWPRALRFIGPLAHNPEAIEIDLPLRAPRVLVTIGTHLLWAKQTLLDEVRALARTLPDVSFVVSLGDPARATRAPLLLEERIALYAYVPYRRTLREFDAVIHHAGAGVTSACIEAERPVLAVPHDYDQFDFAARIVHHGLGLSARRIGSDDAAQKLRRLLAEPWPALAQFAAHHARYRPAASFLGVVHELTGTRATGAAA